MIPDENANPIIATAFPRIGGGDPITAAGDVTELNFSPHRRG